jgi:hypothetical protein
MTHITSDQIIKEQTIPYTESTSKVNMEKTREVYCPYCNKYAITALLGPKCSICKHEMLTVIK